MCFVHNNPEAEALKKLSVVGVEQAPLGFYLRVIVNETHINLEKTTSSVISVILINLCSLL